MTAEAQLREAVGALKRAADALQGLRVAAEGIRGELEKQGQPIITQREATPAEQSEFQQRLVRQGLTSVSPSDADLEMGGE